MGSGASRQKGSLAKGESDAAGAVDVQGESKGEVDSFRAHHLVGTVESSDREGMRIYENTTIVIADVVDPPDIINHYTGGARSLIVLLKRLFSAFNALALQFGVRKIRAVSDSWVAISGLEDNIKSAESAVAMSNEMIKIADEMDIPIRVGLHTGPVTAGRLKPGAPFDIWGSSVKEAALMLALCPPLRVNVSSITYECVYERFVFESREVCIGSECRFSYLLNMDLDEQILPPSPPSPTADKPNPRLKSLVAGRKVGRNYLPKILVVEDNTVARKMIERILTRLNCFVEIASNGKEALDILMQRWPFDVVLMDIEMPVMDGWQATERIRFDFIEPMRSVPIVALTSHATIDDARRCLEEGMDDFITKPVKEEVLKQVLEKWISDFAPQAILPTSTATPREDEKGGEEGGGQSSGDGSASDGASVKTQGEESYELDEKAVEITNSTVRKVLVVDDNALVRKIMGRFLEKLNCTVLFASNGKEGLEMIQSQWPMNVVFMDIVMPEMDGFDTTQAIRELDPPFRDVPVIALTGYTSRELCNQCIDAGMDDFVTKPLRRGVLQDLLKKWIAF